MRKSFVLVTSVLLSIFILIFTTSELYAITIDLRHLTFGFYREDWPVIHKDKILWLDEGVVKGFDFKSNEYFNLFPGDQPLSNLYGLVGYDEKYLTYISLTEENSFDVSVYDFLRQVNILITEDAGSQWATDYDSGTVLYIDGSPCGELFVYNLNTNRRVLVSDTACYAKLSGNNVVWAYGDTIYGYYLNDNEQFMVTLNGAHPDIYGNNAVWLSKEGETTYVISMNLKTGKERILHQTDEYGITWPAISQRYVVWGKTTEPDVAGVEGVDLITGEIFEIQEQGSHQNGVIAPQIEGDITAWMAWRTGNGDIYAVDIDK